METNPILVGLTNGRVTHLSTNISMEERISFIHDGCESVVLMPENINIPEFKALHEIKFIKVEQE